MIKHEKIKYFNSIALERAKWRKRSAYYHRELEKYLRFLIPPNSCIIEIGSGTGELLKALNPSIGLGIDISSKIVEVAKELFPDLQFEVGDLENLHVEEHFNYVLLVDVIGHVNDIQLAFKELHKVCKPETRIIIVYYNYLWEPVLKFAEKIGLKMRQPLKHWLPLEEISNLLFLNNFEVIKKRYNLLLPIYIPFLSGIFNKFLANMPFFWRFSLNEILIARPMEMRKPADEVTCSVVIPCRNEKGNIEKAVLRIPDMGKHTENYFC